MAQINKPSEHFNTKLYTGTGASNSITGVGFQPDLTWVKSRSNAEPHIWTDVVRGTNKNIRSNANSSEFTDANNITSFDSDGFTLGTGGAVNENTYTFASWNWLADNTSGSSNTDGSITSNVSANTTAGFSIVSYTGTGANATVGHGLGANMDFAIFKLRSGSSAWLVYHKSLGATKAIYLNETGAVGTNSSGFNDTEPTSSVFSLGSGATANTSSGTQIAYCFAEKKGFSKAFSYTGNGSSDGSFTYLGFRPAFVMIKRTDSTSDWVILDNKRDSFNLMNKKLFSNNSDSEYSGQNACDFLSNGFKLRDNATNNFATNISGATYIGIAFAENPLVGTNNIPATAR